MKAVNPRVLREGRADQGYVMVCTLCRPKKKSKAHVKATDRDGHCNLKYGA